MNKKDRQIDRTEMKRIERKINEHTKMWCKVLNVGEQHDHFKRIARSKVTHSEQAASKYLMYKDHKEGGGYRPVVSGCNSNTLGLSNLLSDVIESLCQSVTDPFEIISSEDMLANIEEFNEEIRQEIENTPEYDWRDDYLLIGTDVVGLFPSLSAENTGKAIREQAEKSKIKWKDVDRKWLALYIHLNRDKCSSLKGIERFLPRRRKGRRGKEAGMGSEECDKRYMEEKPESNWEWPTDIPSEEMIKRMMGAALDIAIVFFFKNFTYTFGGKLYVQLSGGPIGARLTMCAARLVLQQWRDEFIKILREADIKEKMSKIYVDHNRCVVEKLRPGTRFNI